MSSNDKRGGFRIRDGYPHSTGNHINNNNIFGNGVWGIFSKTDSVVDATNNWWGAVDGPSGVGVGSGDAVSTNVNFTPWLTGTSVGLAADVEAIIAINVSPTSIDFGTITPGTSSPGGEITVRNIGQVTVAVNAYLDPIGGAFEYLFLSGRDHPGSGAWSPGDLGMGNMIPTSIVKCPTRLNVPATYSAKGEESATLIFIASTN